MKLTWAAAPDLPAWTALQARALLPAAGAGPGWGGALAGRYGAACIIAGADAAWQGLFFLRKSGLFLPLLRTTRTPLTFSGLGLLGHDRAAETMAALIRGAGRASLQLWAVPGSGPFHDALTEGARLAGTAPLVLERWQRAALETGLSPEAWFEANFERKRRKEYRRLRARLAEQGVLASVAWQPGEALEPWIDAHFALEARGWKGARGTAMTAKPGEAAAYRQALHSLAATGALRYWKITLDGEAIAMLFAIVEGGQAWLGKIAHDETLARYSPGVLVILDATATLLTEPGLVIADSCADPGHPMIDNIWRGRIGLISVIVPSPALGPTETRLLLARERAKLEARALARNLLHRWRKGIGT